MLVPCKRCSRHISLRDELCPFCRHGNALARVGAAALSAGMLLAACDQGVPPQQPRQDPEQHGSAAPVVVKPAWARLHGILKDRAGKVLPAANITLTLVTPTDPAVQTNGTTDATGHFAFEHLAAGPYTVSVSFASNDRGFRLSGYAQQQMVLESGEDRTMDMSLDVRELEVAPPYGAPPARRRVV